MSEALVVRDSASGASRLGRQNRQLLWQRHRAEQETHVSTTGRAAAARSSPKGGLPVRTQLGICPCWRAGGRPQPALQSDPTDHGPTHCLCRSSTTASTRLAGQAHASTFFDADGSVESVTTGGIPVDIHDRTGLSWSRSCSPSCAFGGGSTPHPAIARRRRQRRQRVVCPPRRRGRPWRQDVCDVLPARRTWNVRWRRRGAEFTAFTDRSELRDAGRRRKNVSGTRPSSGLTELPDAVFSFDGLLT